MLSAYTGHKITSAHLELVILSKHGLVYLLEHVNLYLHGWLHVIVLLIPLYNECVLKAD